jgi:hypothetical protein
VYDAQDIAGRCQHWLIKLAQDVDGLSESLIAAGSIQLFGQWTGVRSAWDNSARLAVVHTFISPVTIGLVTRALFVFVDMKAKSMPCTS